MNTTNRIVKVLKENGILIITLIISLFDIFVLRVSFSKVFSFVLGMVILDIILSSLKKKKQNNKV